MAICGWERLKQAEFYTREANRILLAGEAMHLLLARPTAGADEQDGNRSFLSVSSSPHHRQHKPQKFQNTAVPSSLPPRNRRILPLNAIFF